MAQPADPIEHYKVIARTIAEKAPQGWTKARMTYRSVSTVSEPETAYEMADGSSKVKVVMSFDLTRAFDALRQIMYQPGKGTWFTAEFTLTREGHFSTDFDFDHEPQWHAPIGAAAYARELKDFPRSPEHTPDWLREAASS
jgi:hypothetical protein